MNYSEHYLFCSCSVPFRRNAVEELSITAGHEATVSDFLGSCLHSRIRSTLLKYPSTLLEIAEHLILYLGWMKGWTGR
ncbi:hypothetical protein M6B38_266425 [Iris pallida]|uniref:Uncharacterized protein n=1 Tax=Iris pallida TaxID=29817 RepID=A0AAX6I9U5_IRIPA|nr:hypothetical protein M6B38_266425 [Iris pallida]